MSNGNIKAELGLDGRLRFVRLSDGALLLAEKAPRTIVPATTAGLAGFYTLDLEFAAVPGERIYGLGQQPTGQLDNKGVGVLELRPRNRNVLIPVAHSSVGYAFMFNLPSFGTVEYNDTLSYWHADAVLQADFWVATTADSPPHATSPWLQLQEAYTNATGHAPVYPEWSSGFWQCKNRYHNQSQVMDVVRGHETRGYPVALVIIDYYSWNPDPLGDETLPPECWPDPKRLVEELRDQGVELMLSPYFHSVTSGAAHFHQAAERDLLAVGPDGAPAQVGYDGAYIYDLFQPASRAYAFNAVRDGYIVPYGLHHFWLDCDEPCGDDAGIESLRYNNRTWPAAFVGAAYPHMLDKMVWEGMAAPGMEYANDNVMLGRSAWAGSQRYGGAVWSGDTSSNFPNLNTQFRAGLNMVMSGIPYWTTDIGGYNGGNISSLEFRELIVRWFQWGAFCPLFRNHGRRSGGPAYFDGGRCGRTGASNEIWNFGTDSEAAIAVTMRIREQLRPYVQRQFEQVAKDGTPVMRPLFVDFWEDPGAATIDDQLMFGPSYMLAPQLSQRTATRQVYLPRLPPGELWQNYFTGALHNTTVGGTNITEQTPLSGPEFGTFPLYERVMPAPYPAPRPPAPPPGPSEPLPGCNISSCAITPDTERTPGSGGDMYQHLPAPTAAACCGLCKMDSRCKAFVWGQLDYTRGPLTCFMLGTHVTGVRHATGRSYGCLRA